MASVYRKYSDYLMDRYGTPVYRVGVDAGFSCPNRSAADSGGCSFCPGSGARSVYSGSGNGLESQIDKGLAFVKSRYGAERFMLYFQAYSGTFAPVDTLKEIYDRGLARAEFSGLIVSTRPDCLDDAVADLIASYKTENGGLLGEVWVELGLQSSRDATLMRINRGHTASDFAAARERLGTRGIPCAAHVILGLPGETRIHARETAGFLSDLDIDGVKIHDLHVVKGTELEREALSGELCLQCERDYAESVADVLERIPARTLVMRLSCETPAAERILPRRQIDKRKLHAEVERILAERGSAQGSKRTGNL